MDIYENIIIGNFLFSLGVAIGARSNTNESPPISVNLLQQTPLDRNTGDVLVRGACAMRLLEFKRLRNDNEKEIAKLRHLEAGLNNQSTVDLIPISRNVHWFIESNNSQSRLAINIRPYLDLENAAIVGPSLDGFIADFVNETSKAKIADENTFSRYLNLLALCQGSPNGASGGLIVVFDEKRVFNYAVIEDLRELGQELSHYHEKFMQRIRTHEIEESPDRNINRSSSRELSR